MLATPVFAGMGGGGMGGGGMGGGGGGMGGGGSSVIDPPVSGPFADPPEAQKTLTADGFVEVNLNVAITSVNVNGTNANLMTYNGSYPGPTIRLNRGDKLRLNLTNSLPPTTQTNMLGYTKHITNLHTHGWHVSPNWPMDFVMYHLMPGETTTHEYDTSLQPGGTLCFYHPHIHGYTAEQVWGGLTGQLVINDETDILDPYETHILVLKDIALSGSNPAPHSTMMDYMHGKEGNIIMVNGKVNPRLNIKAGQVQRWRILNASNARFYRLALDSHLMYVIGCDGGLLNKPVQVSEILVSPGERVDLLVKATKSSGSYKFNSLPYSRMGMMGQQTITLMTVTYNGKLSQSLPRDIDPLASRIDTSGLMIMAERTIELSMGQGNGYINGMDFDVEPFMVHSMVGTYEIWNIVNNSGMDHPFHQHTNAAQVLSISGGDSKYASLYTTTPAMKDTILVPKWGTVRLLVPIMDYDGMAMFHCHILEHEDIGMLAVWMIMSEEEPMPDM